MFQNTTLFLAGLTIAATLVSCGGNADNPGQGDNPGMEKTTAATSLEAYDLSGTLRRFDEWIGKQPVVVNIWGTWCPPCRREIPDLIKLYDEFGPKGVEIIGLAVERGSPDNVGRFAQQMGMQWVMLIGSREHLVQYQTSSVPTTIFYDRNGNVVGRMTGMRSYEEFRPAFELIAES
jgi:thiol-disulfide isomerase/thioredoxin